jgi:hypothetical protein
MRSETVAQRCYWLPIGLFESFQGSPICDRLPVVAPTGLHKCSMLGAGIADAQRGFRRLTRLGVDPSLEEMVF